jgi:rhodanese-related sulfurtransferase
VTTKEDDMTDSIAEVDVEALAHELQQGRPLVVLDVREPWEHKFGSLPSAQFVPLSEMPQCLASLQVAKDADVVTVCHHGMRSIKAATWLQHAGFSHVRSLRGGTDAWAQHVDPSLGRY